MPLITLITINENLIQSFSQYFKLFRMATKLIWKNLKNNVIQQKNLYNYIHVSYYINFVYKILIHEREIINSALLLISQMSEEAQEYTNK